MVEMGEEDGQSTKTTKSSATASERPASPSESTPLLPKENTKPQWGRSVVLRVLFTAFLVSVSFSITQVPMIYVFGVMTCDEYYKTHADPGPIPGRCRNPEIEASTARSVALVGASTTLFGVLNLFYTGWAIKRFGIKSALMTSVFWPAVRLAVQNVGVQMGYGVGIMIIQASQIITIVGGPAGYLLALNSFATEIVQPHERTATLGRLTGCSFFGTSLGYLCGGLLSDALGVPAPFEVTLVLFIVSCIYIGIALPSVPLHLTPENEKKSRSLLSFFEPLKMFVPRKWVLENGRIQREYGVLLLGIGASLAVLATGYIPVLLQMYSTDVLDFGTTENGWLISLNALVRGLFLTFAFPALISGGRTWIDRRQNTTDKIGREESAIPELPTGTGEFEPGMMDENTEPTEPPKPGVGEEESFVFDLYYTRYSILVDGILTGLATFTTQGWHMFVIAVMLPLAAGTGSAAKGTILQMCAPEERADALSAISLVEMVGRLSSTGVFGLIFSAFATIGKPYLTFTCNAGVAVFAFAVLFCAKFPPRGSRRVDMNQDDD